MNSLIVTIIFGLIAAAVAHPPVAADTSTEKPITKDEKPITEASAEPSSIEKTDEQLPIKIYYEGLCPDSRKLLSDLGREYYVFQEYISLDFIPFGRAKSLDADGNAFECHHGPKECIANRIHSCGLNYLKSQNAKQQFVVCQMRQEADQTGKECAEEAGGNWREIGKCINGNEGKKLQLIAELETKEISKPKLENVPTIVFNNKYDEDLNNKALKGLKAVLCDMLSSKNISDCS